MVDLPSSHNGEDVWRFVHDIRQRHARHLRLLPLRNTLQHLRHLDLRLRRRRHVPPLAALPLLLALEVAAPERPPRRETHALGVAHGDDVALKVPLRRRPPALIDDELAQPVVARVLVGLADDPRGRVADAEVEDLAGADEVVERLHELGDGGGEVPPVDVQQIDIVGPQLLEAVAHGEVQRLGRVADEVGVEGGVVALVGAPGGGELGGDDHLVAHAALREPFADPLLGLLVLVVVGRVDEVAALGVEEVHHFEGRLFVAFAHHALPVELLVHVASLTNVAVVCGSSEHSGDQGFIASAQGIQRKWSSDEGNNSYSPGVTEVHSPQA